MSRTNKELFKIDFCNIVKFDCKCGRRYINTSNCRQCTDSYEKQTNSDRIRSMTDDELAESRIDRIDIYCKSDTQMWTGDFNGIAENKEEALQLEKEWLEREVEE